MEWLKSFWGSRRPEDNEVKNATMMDVVVYVAGLASNPAEINPMLDRVRVISSRLKPGHTLTPADVAELSKVYGELETYLIEKDPKKLSKEEIRRRVRAQFPATAGIMGDGKDT